MRTLHTFYSKESEKKLESWKFIRDWRSFDELCGDIGFHHLRPFGKLWASPSCLQAVVSGSGTSIRAVDHKPSRCVSHTLVLRETRDLVKMRLVDCRLSCYVTQIDKGSDWETDGQTDRQAKDIERKRERKTEKIKYLYSTTFYWLLTTENKLKRLRKTKNYISKPMKMGRR